MRHPIPEDLKDRHNELRIWLNSPQQYREERPSLLTLEDEMQDIERIAALTAELAAMAADRNLYRDDHDGDGHPYSEVLALKEQLREAKQEAESFQFVVKQFMDAMGGDTKGMPPWEKVAAWKQECATLRATVARLTVACEYVLNTPNVECLHVAPKDLSCARCKIDDALIASRAKEPQDGESNGR